MLIHSEMVFWKFGIFDEEKKKLLKALAVAKKIINFEVVFLEYILHKL